MICRKCRIPSTLTIRKEYNFCDDCFLSYIDHKFRACLGKNKKLTANEKVLVCLSDGINSAALLNLVYNGISLTNQKKLRISPYFLHVTGIEKSSNEEVTKKLLLEQCEKYDFQVYVIDINHYYSSNNILHCEEPKLDEKIKQWKVSSTTNYDLLTQIKQNLFIRVAKELQCKIIFTGETTTTLAVNLISNIAIGRGSQIENNIGFCDKKDGDVEILRPMRDITTEEIENYVKIKKLVSAPNQCIQSNSLQSIIKDFVSGLQDNFPATITTVCKTADKLSSTSDSNVIKHCLFCKSSFHNDDVKLTAAEATTFSSYVSSTKLDIYDTNNIHNFNSQIDLMSNRENLCYCCKKNIIELSKSGVTDIIKC